VQSGASLVVDGSAASVPVSVAGTAVDAEVTAKVPIVLTTTADVKIVLEKGAEGSKVNTDVSASVSVKVTNHTSVSVEVSTTAGTKVGDIPAGYEKDVVAAPAPVSIPSLEVGSCKSLEKLYCANNQLSSLNVSECTALKELSCESNRLTSLDVSNCTELTDLSYDEDKFTAVGWQA